ncbi:MAG: Tim44-like domain-containing protein [Rhodocyclaceae bacterium]|nr:Tim44-like domain-containing protein [Rhodocyclaceae bacterium]
MRYLLITCFTALIGLGLMVQDAEARRMGGGKSFGMSRSGNAMQRQSAPPSAPAATPKPAQGATAAGATPPASGASRWLGPLAGIAAGIGLAAMLSHFGLGEGFGTILLIAALVFGAFFLFRMLSKRSAPALQPAGKGMRFEAPANVQTTNQTTTQPSQETDTWSTPAVPDDFDVTGFLREAKLGFLRLQAANDDGNLDDLRQFVTPEVLAEITLQLDEREGKTQQTDVTGLEAELTDLVTEAGHHIASVRFYGQIKESEAPLTALDEVWHMTKPTDGRSGWVVAGIQQF